MLIGDIQVGFAFYSNVNIPIIDKKAYEFFSKVPISEPLSTLMKLANAESESEKHTLYLDANTVVVNQYQQTNGQVIRARRELSIYAYNNIIATIKDKLLNIFKILEENYGNLDELYIDFFDSLKQKEVAEKIEKIVYNDNSIHMGDNNSIKDSKIGDNNENWYRW